MLFGEAALLILGGLVDDQILEVDEKVPFLGDIPGVGNLFRSRSSTVTKRTLMVFIRPVIIRDAETATIETNAKYNYIREVLRGKSGESIQLMRGEDRFALPPFEEASGVKVGETPIANENEDDSSEDE